LLGNQFSTIREASIAALEKSHRAREAGLQASRKAIQLSSQAIRAAHRGEYDEANRLCDLAGRTLSAAYREIASEPLVRYSGFMHDGEKEYAEAAVVVSLLSGPALPSPETLGISHPAFLNGLAEGASELRRSALDAIRRGDPKRADELLTLMDEAMGVLEVMDFPEAVTSGLRRTTDALRSVVERTRGDVTAALRQQALEARLKAVEGKLGR
jgi:translin